MPCCKGDSDPKQCTCRQWTLDLVILLNRLSMGGFFLLASVGKFRMGYPAWLHYYHSQTPSFVPSWFANPYGYVVPVAEMVVGALLVLGLWTRGIAAVALLMILSFSISMASVGKFSVGGNYSPNVIMMTMLLFLVVLGSGRLGVDRCLCNRCEMAPGTADSKPR